MVEKLKFNIVNIHNTKNTLIIQGVLPSIQVSKTNVFSKQFSFMIRLMFPIELTLASERDSIRFVIILVGFGIDFYYRFKE